MMEKGKENVAAKQAQQLGFDDIDRALAGALKPGENRVGSFEALMGWASNGMTKRQ